VEKERATWWSPRLLEALAACYAIVVEGISDRIVVEAAARVMGIGLDRIGAVVFDIDGAHTFPHVYKLIGKDGFCVTILGLVDEAEKLVWHGAIGGKLKTVFETTLWASDGLRVRLRPARSAHRSSTQVTASLRACAAGPWPALSGPGRLGAGAG
jgi:putative ATP-dependent endonuclease of OLD family